jgi:hypothetical protein
MITSPKTVVFTLCSANYLAHAKVLGDSLIKHNPHYRFVIGLVDRVSNAVSPAVWSPFELIEVEALNIPDFAELCSRYSIVELNTAVKPFYLEHLYKRDPSVEHVIYMDPDIMVFAPFCDIDAELEQSNAIIIPHALTAATVDSGVTYEIGMLRTGVYNLGFIATSRSDETQRLIVWWQERLRKYCYYQPGSGMFVDQIWGNLMAVFFQGVHVSRNPGLNMCYWNLHERALTERNGSYWVNDAYALGFYHFSSFDPRKPENICNRGVVHPVANRPDLAPLFREYTRLLLLSGYEELKLVQCAFYSERETTEEPTVACNRPAANKPESILCRALRRIYRALEWRLRRN